MGLSEKLVSNLGRIRRKVVFPERSSRKGEHEETMQSDSDEESVCGEPEGELETASDSDVVGSSGSDSSDEGWVKGKANTLDTKHKGALLIAGDSSEENINFSSENKSKKQKLKGTLADTEYRLLNMMAGDEDECDDEEDEVPTKKLKLIDAEVKENQSRR